MADAFIYDHVRTPRGRGKSDGSLHEVTALALAATPLKALKERNNLNVGDVDDVVLGCVDPVGEAGGDIARMAALSAGYGNTVPGVQINRFCASGLDAVNFAAAQVMSGQHSLTIGGGVESMSRVGMLSSGAAWPMDPSIAVPSYFMPQGISADLIATKYGFSRDDVDAYAVESQNRAAKSWDEGYFKNSVVPVKDINGITILAKDEHMRPGTTMQSLAQLQPSFVQIGEMGGFDAVAVQDYPEIESVIHVHHAGNSSGIVDGAAAVLIGSKEAGTKAGLKPRAKIRAFANIGSEPGIMLTGPVDVTKKVLERSGMKLSDIDLFELNEAFASVVLRYQQAFDIDSSKINVNGGAIALGHPLGATGAMILGTVLDELERRKLKHRAGHAVHRRRHGHGNHHRARLIGFRSIKMAYKNFKVETDADGIALVTWDIPGKSMNVFDLSVIEELDKIVAETTADANVKGVVVTSGKDALSSGADLTMLDSMRTVFADLLKTKGKEAANEALFKEAGRLSQIFRRIETTRQAVGRGHQRPRARRRLRIDSGVPLSRRLRQSEDTARPARKSRSDCSRVPAARSGWRACCSRPMR